mgnify:CR=1 FL=1
MSFPFGKVAHQPLIDRRVLESEVVDILGERQFGDGELVFDRARLLLRYLRLQEIADEALRLVFSFERRGERFVIGALHAVELERAHVVEDFGSFHVRGSVIDRIWRSRRSARVRA